MRSYNDKSICCFRFKQYNTICITNLGERWTTSTVRLSHTMCECLYLFFSASLILLVLLSWGVNELLSIIECFFSFFINSFCLIDHLLNSSICLFLAQLGYFPSKPKSLLISDTSTFKGGSWIFDYRIVYQCFFGESHLELPALNGQSKQSCLYYRTTLLKNC